MNINKTINPSKSRISLVSIILFSSLFSINIFAQFFSIVPLSNITVSQTTGAKPQSKVWKYDGKWWCVLPNSSGGTRLYRLDGTSWSDILQISVSTNSKADCKVYGDSTYVLLFLSTSAQLFKLTYSGGTYSKTPLASITLDSGVETATIDIDSQGIIWLASDEKVGESATGTANINVRWSAYPFSSWTKVTLATDPKYDVICAVTAFGGNKIGVLWSNQNTKKFHFAYHVDGDPTTTWTYEDAATTPDGYPAGGVADDHIGFSVDGGTIYAAIKTSYDASGYTRIGLLRRLANGTWNLYTVTTGGSDGTRPMALLNTFEGTIKVIYTDNQSSPTAILSKEALTSDLIFPSSAQTLISGSYNNATSTKQNFTYEVVILASTSTSPITAAGVIAYDTDPVPVELAFFSGMLNGNKVELRWRTETEVNNYGFNIERKAPLNPPEGGKDGEWITIGFVEGHGNSNSPKYYDYLDDDIDKAGEYHYRLKQIDNDGTFEYSDIVTVQVATPGNFYLSQNYPNPFNPTTRIDFSLAERQMVSLRVYNTLGELVGELVNEIREPGSYSVIFDASNLPGGTYLYIISAGKYFAANKMSLIK